MYYIFVRFFPQFTSSFPIDQFKDLPEDEIETALRAAVEAQGPSDAAMTEQMNSARNEALKRSPGCPVPSRHPPLPVTPAMRNYAQIRDALIPPTNEAALEQLLINKLAWMKWITRPCLWNWDFGKQHVLVTVATAEMAGKVLAELSKTFGTPKRLRRYGITGVLAFGIVEEASLSAGDQVAWNRDLRKREATFDDSNDRSTLMQMCRETVELVGRLSPQHDARQPTEDTPPILDRDDERQGQSSTPTPNEVERWLIPTTLTDMANRLGNVSSMKVKTILHYYGLKHAGNRQAWTVRLDKMPSNFREKLEKVQ